MFSWLRKLFTGGSSRPATPPPLPRANGTAPTPAPGGGKGKPQNKKLGGLDLGAGFAPMQHSEVRRHLLRFGRPVWNMVFGRRDLIPPAADERTHIIDRAMVGQGLITAEELQQIHETGLRMDELRPDLAMVQAKAQAAVSTDKAERERLKQQKKAEAAQKKEAHEAAVRQRRATDIIFLGRDVSAGLNDRRSNIEKLQASGLPLLSTPADVAQALGLPLPRLRWLAYHSETVTQSHYVYFQIPKKSGGMRTLSAPHTEMARCQQWILGHILNLLPLHDCAHGFVKGRGIMSNAVPHVDRELVVNLDLKDFFPSITFPRVRGLFQGMGYSPAVATILALLCTECPRLAMEYAGTRVYAATGPRALPQGACTSPALSNLCARKLDARLQGLARKLGFTYTRYADDLTFSAKGEAAANVGALMMGVRRFTTDEKFTVNEDKTRVQRPHARQMVTGIVVNQRPNVPRSTRRRLRAILHNAGKTGVEGQNRAQNPFFSAWLQGMISFVHMANPDYAKKLRERLDKLRP